MTTRSQTIDANARTRSGRRPSALTLLLMPALGLVAVLFGGGLVLGFLQSLGYIPAAGMREFSFQHFENILTDPDFLRSFGLTFYVSAVSTVIAGALSTSAALFLNRLRGPRRLIDFVFEIPLAVPHLVVATAAVFLLAPSGMISRVLQAGGLVDGAEEFPMLINDPWCVGIIITYVWKEIPFITLMVMAVLKSIGTELLEAARTLNADRWQRFRYVVLPTIFPSLGAACLIVFAFTFGAFEVPYLLGQTYPMILPVWAYRNYSDIDLMARPEGIATGLVIAGVIFSAIILSQALTRLARRRGVII